MWLIHLKFKSNINYLYYISTNIVTLNKPMDLSIKSSEVINFEYSNKKLNPFYVTGFADGECCFLININLNILIMLKFKQIIT